ncbi:MAG: NRDE family protein [Xanthomonadaceae bacterium]|jgi:uncharacterized protein with NRDE domain|nr:NRDE family protein [Xanthomonadaceae bacterium]
MCLIAFSWKTHPRWRLLLAGNRDEFHARPTAPLAAWNDAAILAGRDLEAGGTWLGVTADSRCAAVTNVRDPHDPQEGISRGKLVSEYLAVRNSASDHIRRLETTAVAYRPFNLLAFDHEHGRYLGNRPTVHALTISAGLHTLSNANFDTPWPKTRALAERLRSWQAQAHDEDFEALFRALADERMAPDAELPDTGVGLERERWLSSAFIRGPQYGTRASTVVAIGYDGRGWIIERRFGPDGRYDGESIQTIG